MEEILRLCTAHIVLLIAALKVAVFLMRLHQAAQYFLVFSRQSIQQY